MLWHFGKTLTHLDSSALWKVENKVAKEIARVMATEDVKEISTPAPYKKVPVAQCRTENAVGCIAAICNLNFRAAPKRLFELTYVAAVRLISEGLADHRLGRAAPIHSTCNLKIRNRSLVVACS